MQVIESNHRYNLHNLGFHCILQFNTRYNVDRQLYLKYQKVCELTYGPVREQLVIAPGESFGRTVMNENWRFDYNAKLKRRRIYLKDMQDYTLLALRA